MSAPVQPQQPVDYSALYDAQQASQPSAPKDFSDLYDQQQAATKATPGLPETILDQASRGLSLGFAPQLMGAIKAIEAPAVGKSVGDAYAQGRDALRAQYDQEAAAHPVISRVADVGGSLGGALLSGGTNLLGSAAERLAPKIAANMLGRVVTRGTLPAIEAGAERAIGETRDNNYTGNVVSSVPASALLGTLFGTAGQLAGAARAAQVGKAAQGAQYAASDAAEINSPGLLAKFRDYIDRPGFAKAYQKAVDDAADEGQPLPSLPQLKGPAPLGNIAAAPGNASEAEPFPTGLPVRLIDAVKRAVDEMHSDGDLTTAARDGFYKDIIGPATKAVPVFGAARQSATDVIKARQLVDAILSPSRSPTATLAGGALGLLAGHTPAAGMGGLAGARLASVMASMPPRVGAVPDATAALGRALAAAAARRQGP